MTRQSLAKAARDVGWSYRHAWGYLRRAERVLGVRLAEALAGKGESRGMTLTSQGQTVLATLMKARDAVRRTGDGVLGSLLGERSAFLQDPSGR